MVKNCIINNYIEYFLFSFFLGIVKLKNLRFIFTYRKIVYGQHK